MSEQQDLEQEQFENLTEEAVDEVQKTEEAVETQEDDDLEPRYKGKTLKDIVKMHQEAEKLIARQSQEVGEVRRLADELIKSQLKPKTEEEPAKVDFFENPEEAIRRAVESNPKVKQAELYALQAYQEQARAQLLSKHPDALELASDPEFRSWIAASKVRTRLAIEADQKFDVEAADELYSLYKERKTLTAKPKIDPVEKANRAESLKKASVETGGSGESSKKIYRRSDIIQLKLTKPQEFEARREEIERAYYEGRVR